MQLINDVLIKGIASSVPNTKIENIELSNVYGDRDIFKLISSIGVDSRYVVDERTTASDLCFDAAKRLLVSLQWDVKDIGAILFVSQTPDYQLPATACILQHRLGLSEQALAFDINLGCSGYVYGLNVAASLINSGIKKYCCW